MQSKEKKDIALFVLMAIIDIVIVIMVSIMLLGCCGEPQTIIKEKIVTITPDPIHDTVGTVDLDTVIVGIKVIEHDTVAVIKYFPKYKYIDYLVKPDTIKLLVKDTIKQTNIIKENIETPLLSKLGLVCLGLIIGIVGFIFLRKSL